MFTQLHYHLYKNKLIGLLTSSLLTVFTFFSGPLYANPDGGVVVEGSAAINQAPGQTTINQSSDRAIINWHGFNIGASEQTTFVQPSSSSMALNRVTGGSPSQIMGKLKANGQIILVNPAGIVFGAGSRVDVAGLIATTANIKNSDFMAGNLHFTQDPNNNASIVNNGTITARDRGLVALVAPGVENNGVIRANMGKVVLASGTEYTIDLYGDQTIQFAANSQTTKQPVDANGNALSSLVSNHGKIYANGGQVLLTAQAAENVVDNVINMDGVIVANSTTAKNGSIILDGGSNGAVNVSGKLIATGRHSGQTGGTIEVLGNHIQLTSTARLNASGDAGGGTILVGGNARGQGPQHNANTTAIAKGAKLNASAITNGNGGKVIIWSNNDTEYQGTIVAKGGAQGGDGGSAEVSGGYLNYQGNTDLTATQGNAGTLLLDPYDLTISTGSTTNVTATSGLLYASSGSPSVLNVTTLRNALNSANVLVETGSGGAGTGNITIDSTVVSGNAITWSGAHTLTLLANNNIIFNTNGGGTVAMISASAGAGLILHADSAGTGVGTISFLGGGTSQISLNNSTAQLFYNPSSYSSPTDFSSKITLSSGASFTAYMLVNTPTNLASISANATTLGGNYALGKNINMTGVAFTPIGASTANGFTGKFNGLNNAISNLTINNSTPNIKVGLFSIISGTVSNLNLVNTTITDTTNQSNIGALAGDNSGIIFNVSSTGTGSIHGGFYSGGLVGNNGGTISTSYNSEPVNGNPLSGGIAGQNLGAIQNVYNTAAIQGGGIVAFNATFPLLSLIGTIQNAYDTGTASAAIAVSNTGTIQSAYWNTVTSGTNTGIIGNSGSITNVTGLTTAQTLQPVNFTDFSFYNATSNPSGVWFMADYPHLTIENTLTITNVIQLQAVETNLSGIYTLANDIDASSAATWNSGAGFNPIGSSATPFKGILNGNNFIISNLPINQPGAATDIGLFADMQLATISNLGLINAIVTGNTVATGALVGNDGVGGNANGSTITNVYSLNGTVSATSGNIGGLVGTNFGTISNSFTTGNVTGSGNVGGFVGTNRATINTSYSASAVSNSANSSAVGGFVGLLDIGGVINNSYSIGSVTNIGSSAKVGGFLGAISVGAVTNSYSSGVVTSSSNNNNSVGGFVGIVNSGTVTGSFWDSSSSGQTLAAGSGSSAGIVGGCFAGSGCLSGIANLSAQSTYTNAGWNFTSPWISADGFTRPFLQMENVSNIQTAHQLEAIVVNPAGSYTLANNIDLSSPLANNSDIWGGAAGSGFSSIGNLGDSNIVTFSGTFNGNSHIINNLTINQPTVTGVGLFAQVFGGTVENIGLANVNITGNSVVGALIGVTGGGETINNTFSFGNVTATGSGGFISAGGLIGYLNVGSGSTTTLSNSFTLGTVTATGSNPTSIGGLVGLTQGTAGLISNSYSMANVVGGSGSDVGGLVGNNTIPIQTSYSIGAVSGTGSNIGGIIGLNNGALLTDLFWGTSTSGQMTAGTGVNIGGNTVTGINNTRVNGVNNPMQTQGTFTGFSFASTWGINEGSSYPYLQWRYTSTPQVVSGIVYTDNGGTTPASSNNNVTLAFTSTNIPVTSFTITSSVAPTFADGSYYYLLDDGTIPNSGPGYNLLAYLKTGSALSGTTVDISIPSSTTLTGLNINNNTVIVRSDNAIALSNTVVGAAKGSLTDPGILYSASSGSNLTLIPGVGYQTPTTVNYTIDGTITASNGAALLFQGPLTAFLANNNPAGITSANNSISVVFQGPVTINNGETALIDTGAGNLTFNNSVSIFNGLAGGGILQINHTNTATFNGAITGNSATSLIQNTGTLALNGNNSNFAGMLSLANTNLILNHANALGTGLINLINANFLSLLPLNNITNTYQVQSASTISGATNLTFNGSGILTAPLTVTDTGTVTINSLANGNGSGNLIVNNGAGTLMLNSTNNAYQGNTTLTSGTLQLGNDNALGIGTLALNGGTLTASSSRTLANNYTVGGNATIGGSKAITFNGAGTFSSGSTLNINTTNNVVMNSTLNGAGNLVTGAGNTLTLTTAIIGNLTPLASMTTNGALALNSSSVNTTGAQTYNGATTLNSNITLESINSSVTFNTPLTLNADSALTSPGPSLIFNGAINGNHALTLNSPSGITTINGAIGNANALSSFTINAGGTTQLANNITTNGLMQLNQNINLLANATLNSGNGIINLNGATNGDYILSLNSNNAINVNGAVGQATALNSFITNGNGAVQLGANINAQGGMISFNNPVQLANNVQLTNTGNAGIQFNNTLNGARNLTLSTPRSNISFNGVSGGTQRLGNVTVLTANNVTSQQKVNVQSFTQNQGSGTTNLMSGLNAVGNIAINTANILGTLTGGNTLLNGSQSLFANVVVSALMLDGQHGGVVNGAIGGFSGIQGALITRLAKDALGAFVVNGCLLPGGCVGNITNPQTQQNQATTNAIIAPPPTCTYAAAAAGNEAGGGNACQSIEIKPNVANVTISSL